jgi:Na+/melibiose symporter-like transporter
MIALPHRAWGAELSPDYHQRSRVTAAREIYVLVGLMVAAAVPMIIEIRADGGAGVGEVFTTLWSDAIGAFSGDFADKKIVDRATLTGPVLAGLAWTVILVLPTCAESTKFQRRSASGRQKRPNGSRAHYRCPGVFR